MIKRIFIIAIALLLFSMPGISECLAQNESVIGEKIAEAYGIEGFDKVKELRYTFNAKLGDKVIERSWVWLPKENKVTYLGSGDEKQDISYNLKNLSDASDTVKEIDSWFINDQYWLVFPFHLVWDEGTRIEVGGESENLPIGTGVTTKVIVTYPDTGGYTPGDVYELYIDENYMILEWVYRRGGSETPTRMSTWQDNKEFGPIIISLDHKGPDESFRVWFADVEVTTD